MSIVTDLKQNCLTERVNVQCNLDTKIIKTTAGLHLKQMLYNIIRLRVYVCAIPINMQLLHVSYLNKHKCNKCDITKRNFEHVSYGLFCYKWMNHKGIPFLGTTD